MSNFTRIVKIQVKLKISCVRCTFVKFDIHFPASSVLAYVIAPWKTYSRLRKIELDIGLVSAGTRL